MSVFDRSAAEIFAEVRRERAAAATAAAAAAPGGVQGRGGAPPRQAGFGDTSEATCQTKPLPAPSAYRRVLTEEERQGERAFLAEMEARRTPEDRRDEREFLAEAKTRAHRVTVRLDDDDAKVLARLRVRYGLTASALMRAGLHALDCDADSRRSAPPPPAVDPEVVRLAREVRSIGVNVNQISRKANAEGIGARSVNALREQVAALVELMDEQVRRR